ncbi:MAG: LTA synthase family protein [Planctomycetaceae bacterium]
MVLVNVAIAVACFSILRTVLLFENVEWRSLSFARLFRIYVVGLRFDVLTALCFALPQALHITVVPHRALLGRVSRLLLEAEWLLGYLLLLLACVIEYTFFDEFQSRLNYIAFEYLVYPTEVCCNIWQSYPTPSLLAAIGVTGVSMYLLLRPVFLQQTALAFSWRRRCRFFAAFLATIGLFWATTGMKSSEISSDRVANECAGNGLYSFVYYAWTCRFDFEENYITLDAEQNTRRLRRQVLRDGDQLIEDSHNPVDRTVDTGRPQRDWNVVLILEESLGSDFVGALGDERGLTPNLDKLTREGILFDRFFATGNRTARALEAVLTSMPPIPTESILKRDHSEHVHTLANVLAERGYERLFMTGGRGLFDGVGSFMTANGFNHFVEQSDFKDPVFVNAWGVSDEDLFRESIRECDRLHETGRPFFATLLTVSNHRPYTFPEGRIPENEQTRQNAVKYADWALGQFFHEAKSHPFYEKTVFVVLGDHGARVYGHQLFPMRSYRVPLLMILPEGEGQATRCGTLSCSLDVPATIMGRLGGSYRSVFFGVDVLRTPPAAGRAIMQHNHDVAWLDSGNRIVVLGFGRTASGFELDPTTFQLRKTDGPDVEMVQNAAAFFHSGYQLYYARSWFPDPAPAPRRPRVALD